MRATYVKVHGSLCLFLLTAALFASCVSGVASDNKVAHERERWSAQAAWKWYEQLPWLVGFNYIPATAINTTEMWQAATFDPATIDREMALAQGVGFNCARVFLQYLVWENDPEGLKRRMDTFLGIATKHGIRTIWVLFDDCTPGTLTEPFLGKQPDVNPGEYFNGWTPSPGPSLVLNRKAWPRLEAYVKDLIGRFHSDQRVLAWDMYNEPGNTKMPTWGDKSLPLLLSVFVWARQAAPTQPLTGGLWSPRPDEIMFRESDIITFHSYSDDQSMENEINELTTRGRPLICTEWLDRPRRCTIETILPLLYKYRVGSMHWGLVNGKTQTNYLQGSKAGAPAPKIWHCDLFRGDFTPYDPNEIELFRHYIGASSGSKR